MRSLRRDLPSGNALFFFEAAARCGNLTRAAEELYVTQPAVSRMLARMEDHLGIKLFERVRAGIELTEDGKILYKKVAEAFSGIEAGIDEIHTRATGLIPVTVSASTAFTTHWLLPRLPLLRAVNPQVDLRVQLNPGRVGEPTIDVDLCVGILKEDDRFADRMVVMPETLLPVCKPDYFAKLSHDEKGYALDTLLLMGDSEYGWHDRFHSFGESKHRVSTTLRLDDYSVVVQAALQGQGIALGWLNVVSGCLVAGSLQPVEQECIVTSRVCSIVSPNGRGQNAIVRGVKDWIVSEMRADIVSLDQRYPDLGLKEKMAEASVTW